MDDKPKMDEYQKAYIELIAQKTAEAVSEKIKKDIMSHITKSDNNSKEIDKRVRKLEKKMFNGINLKINLLYAFYVSMLAVLIKLAFFH